MISSRPWSSGGTSWVTVMSGWMPAAWMERLLGVK
jgi:hypothetical protein